MTRKTTVKAATRNLKETAMTQTKAQTKTKTNKTADTEKPKGSASGRPVKTGQAAKATRILKSARRQSAIDPNAVTSPVKPIGIEVPAPTEPAPNAPVASAAAAPRLNETVEAVAVEPAKTAPARTRGKQGIVGRVRKNSVAVTSPLRSSEIEVPAPTKPFPDGPAVSPPAAPHIDETIEAVDVVPAKPALARARTAKGTLGRVRKKPEAAAPKALPVRYPGEKASWSDLIIPEQAFRRGVAVRRVVGYLRYSTRNQNRDSFTRQAQLIREYCLLNGFELVALYGDEATSGTKKNRPGLEAAIKLIADGRADTLIAEDCDRYARKGSILPDLHERVEVLRGELWTINLGHIDDGIIASILGAIAAADHKKTVTRFAAGLRISIRYGRFPRLPIGYLRVAKGVWIIDEPAAEAIRTIFRLFLQEVSIHKITNHLGTIDMPTRPDFSWTASYVRALLFNPIFIGVYAHARKRGNRKTMSPTFIVEAPHLRIVSQDVFDAAQVKLRARTRKKADESAQPEPVSHYSFDILKHRVYCCECGRLMQFNTRTDGMRRLRCVDPSGLIPTGHHVPADAVRDAVFYAVERRLLNPTAEAIFDEATEAKRARERKALANEKISLKLKLGNANDLADASMSDEWMEGSSADRRRRMREQLETNVVAIQDRLFALERRQRTLDEAGAVRETLRERLGRFRAEGCDVADSAAAFDLVHALRSVVVGATLRMDRANACFDVSVVLAPNGDAEFSQALGRKRAAQPQAWRDLGEGPEPSPQVEVETVVDETRIFLRKGRRDADEFMTRVHAALDGGWLSLDEDAYARLEARSGALRALPTTWSVSDRITLVRCLLVCQLTNLPLNLMDAIGRIGGEKLDSAYYRFREEGGVEQLRKALEMLKINGLPLISGAFLPPSTQCPVVRWSPEW